MAGTQIVGLYEIAFEIANLPTGELVWPIQRALFPGYAKLSRNTPDLIRSYIGGLAVILLIALPATVGITAIAPLLVKVFLGPNWTASIPLLQVLSIAGMLRIMQANSGSVLLALGKAREISMMGAIGFAALVPSVVGAALVAGPVGVAWAIVAIQFLGMVMIFTVTLRLLRVSVMDVLAAIWRTLVAAAVMGLVVTLLRRQLDLIAMDWARHAEILLLCSAGAIIYASLVLILWFFSNCPEGAERSAVNLIARFLTRARLAVASSARGQFGATASVVNGERRPPPPTS